MRVRVVRPVLGIRQLGQAQLADVARERRLGDGVSLSRERLPEIFLVLDAPLAHDPEDRRLALDLHAPVLSNTCRPPSQVATTASGALFMTCSAGTRPRRRASRMTATSPHFPAARLPISPARPSARAPSSGAPAPAPRRHDTRPARAPPAPRPGDRAPATLATESVPTPTRSPAGSAAGRAARRRARARRLESGQWATATPAAASRATSPDVRLHHVDAERPLAEHAVLSPATRPATGPAGRQRDAPALATPRRIGPRRPEKLRLRGRFGQMHREGEPLRRGVTRPPPGRAARSPCTAREATRRAGPGPTRTARARPPAARSPAMLSAHLRPGAARTPPGTRRPHPPPRPAPG